MTQPIDTTAKTPASSAAVWGGRILRGLPIVMMVGSGASKLAKAPELMKMMIEKFGFNGGQITTIALIELVCAVLFAVPQTALLGAVLTTAYFGGAAATHFRFEGTVPFGSVMIAVLAWASLYVTDARVRALLPLRKK